LWLLTSVLQGCCIVDEGRAACNEAEQHQAKPVAVIIIIIINNNCIIINIIIALRAIALMGLAWWRPSSDCSPCVLSLHPQRSSCALSQRLLSHRLQNVAESPLIAALEDGDLFRSQVCPFSLLCFKHCSGFLFP
jgi:hypothetical protein